MLHSEIEPKTEHHCISPETDLKIAEQIAIATHSDNFRLIGIRTGYCAETTRRYLRVESRIPANFIRQVALQYKHDSNSLLCLPSPEPVVPDPQMLATEVLVGELGRRMKMIENCAVASAVVSSGMF